MKRRGKFMKFILQIDSSKFLMRPAAEAFVVNLISTEKFPASKHEENKIKTIRHEKCGSTENPHQRRKNFTTPHENVCTSRETK